jgi:YbbR domain-containing protein
MRPLLVGLLFGAVGLSFSGVDVRAESASTRVATMGFDECLSIISEVSQEVDEEPVRLVSTGDLVTVRINASDGFVTVSCSRIDSRMTLTRSAVPAAAALSASR